jgi:hypothetical protein
MDEQELIESFEKRGPGFSYVQDFAQTAPSYLVTYGLSVNSRLPELIICGSPAMLQSLSRMYDELITATQTVASVRDIQHWPVKFNGHTTVSRAVHSSNLTDDWFEGALAVRRHAGLTATMPAHQLFWPDREGHFPWDKGASATLRWIQPALYQPHVRLEDMRLKHESLRHRAEVLVLSRDWASTSR